MGDSALAVRDQAVSFRHRADRIPLDFLIRIAVVLWSVLLFAPWDPSPFNTGPGDRAYTIFSSLAFSAGHPWGAADALHTGGPLGFLRFRIFSAPIFPLLLLVNGAIGATAGLLTDEIIRRRLNTWARLPLTFAAMALVAVSDEAVWLFVLLLSQLLIPEICRRRTWRGRPDLEWFTWPLLLDLAACAIAANAKGQFLLMAAVLAIEIAFLELWNRRPPVVSLAFIAVLALLAHFAGFKLTDWGPYAKHILDSTNGYAETFALAGSRKQAALLLLSACGLMALAAFTGWRSSNRVGNLIRWTGGSMLIWIAAKGALTRQDEAHTMRPVASLIIFSAL